MDLNVTNIITKTMKIGNMIIYNDYKSIGNNFRWDGMRWNRMGLKWDEITLNYELIRDIKWDMGWDGTSLIITTFWLESEFRRPNPQRKEV